LNRLRLRSSESNSSKPDPAGGADRDRFLNASAEEADAWEDFVSVIAYNKGTGFVFYALTKFDS